MRKALDGRCLPSCRLPGKALQDHSPKILIYFYSYWKMEVDQFPHTLHSEISSQN